MYSTRLRICIEGRSSDLVQPQILSSELNTLEDAAQIILVAIKKRSCLTDSFAMHRTYFVFVSAGISSPEVRVLPMQYV